MPMPPGYPDPEFDPGYIDHYIEPNAEPEPVKNMIEEGNPYYDLPLSIKTNDKKLASDLVAIMPLHPLPNLAGDTVSLKYSLQFGLNLPDIEAALEKIKPFLDKIKERPECLDLKKRQATAFLRYLAKSIESAERYAKDTRTMFEMFLELFNAVKKQKMPKPDVTIE